MDATKVKFSKARIYLAKAFKFISIGEGISKDILQIFFLEDLLGYFFHLANFSLNIK